MNPCRIHIKVRIRIRIMFKSWIPFNERTGSRALSRLTLVRKVRDESQFKTYPDLSSRVGSGSLSSSGSESLQVQEAGSGSLSSSSAGTELLSSSRAASRSLSFSRAGSGSLTRSRAGSGSCKKNLDPQHRFPYRHHQHCRFFFFYSGKILSKNRLDPPTVCVKQKGLC